MEWEDLGKFIGLIIAVPLFLIVMVISGISGCSRQNKQIDASQDYGKATVAIRYYSNVQYDENGVGDYDNAEVSYTRVYKKLKKNSEVLEVTIPAGYSFQGFFSDLSFSEDSRYTDYEGVFVRNLTNADDQIVLYPCFIEL